MEIVMAMTVCLLKMTKSTNPISLAVMILSVSLITTMALFKNSLSSWLSYVTILTFSSGMMTLFMYTASLSSNEKTNTKKVYHWIYFLPFVMIMQQSQNMGSMQKETMKMFTMKTTLVMAMLVIVMTMLTISSHGHHPNQTLSSSF